MRRRIRWIRMGKWVGAVTLAAIAAIWFVSGWCCITRWFLTLHGGVTAEIGRGCVVCNFYDSGLDPAATQWWKRWWQQRSEAPQAQCGFVGWEWSVHAECHPPSPDFIRTTVQIPLWAPWLMVLLPTLWLWRLDRRRPPGACPACAYNLTGNTTGVCPECGKGRS
jgi:hypothetical protein